MPPLCGVAIKVCLIGAPFGGVIIERVHFIDVDVRTWESADVLLSLSLAGTCAHVYTKKQLIHALVRVFGAGSNQRVPLRQIDFESLPPIEFTGDGGGGVQGIGTSASSPDRYKTGSRICRETWPVPLPLTISAEVLGCSLKLTSARLCVPCNGIKAHTKPCLNVLRILFGLLLS